MLHHPLAVALALAAFTLPLAAQEAPRDVAKDAPKDAPRAAAQEAPREAPKQLRLAPLGRLTDGAQPTVADYEGKVLVAFFWASWCGYCRKEMPVLERVQELAGEQQLRVVGINVEPSTDYRRVQRALAGKLRMQLSSDADGQAAQAFAAPKGVPYTVIFNRDGSVRATYHGWDETFIDGFAKNINAALTSR